MLGALPGLRRVQGHLTRHEALATHELSLKLIESLCLVREIFVDLGLPFG